MTAYFNENDPAAAAWLRNLISAGLIAPGVVDERSIADVQPNDLEGFTQCHFFAGIGGWSFALRLAGWPDERPAWTGSCPCQPFSVAGRGKGGDDARHLWPEFARLIAERKPTVVFGEQVASAAGKVWLSRVRVDLETLGYGVGAADLCAAGVGAPHIRQRLWWVADAERDTGGAGRAAGESGEGAGTAAAGASVESGRCGSAGGMAGAHYERCRETRSAESRGGAGGSVPLGRVADAESGRDSGSDGPNGILSESEQRSTVSGLADADRQRCAGEHALLRPEENGRQRARAVSEVAGSSVGSGPGNADNQGSQGWGVLRECRDKRSPWASSLDCWIPCGDGKARRIEPGLEPLAHGVPARVAALRGYGNAIVPQVAEAFIRAYTEI